MKKVIIILSLIMTAHITAQKSVTKAEWQSDLRFLQETIHESFPFLFKKIKAKEFDTKIDLLYNNIPNLEDHEIVVGFGKIISSFEYGHTDISFTSSPVTLHKLPLQIYEFTDGIYITGAQRDCANTVGAKILKIEGKPIKEVLKAIYPVVPAENEYYFKAYGISYMLWPEILHAVKVTETLKKEISVEFEKDGIIFTEKIEASDKTSFPIKYGEVINQESWISARDVNKSPLYLQNLEKRYFFKYLEKDKTLYVRYSQVLNDPTESIAAFYNRVFDFVSNNQVDKFILDVRLNSGGNNYNNKQVITKVIEHKKINQKGKLFVVIGRRTFSAAQNLVNEFDNYTNVTLVGEPTAENINFYGDSKRIRLPKSGLNTYLSFAWWQDKPQWENADYTRPDIKVQMSFKEYVSNQDPILEKILSIK